MARHVVIGGPVDHDGRVYQDGEEVDLSASAAEALVALSVVVEVKAPAGRKAKEPTKPAAAGGE